MLPNQFIAGTTILSAKVNENFAVLGASGIVQMFAGSTAPTGWLLCDGQAVSRATYAELFAVIGTTYGVGDGSTTFNVPNFKGRIGVGYDSGQTEFNALGKTGGAKTHTLAISELPSHYHTVDPPATNTGYISADHTHSGSLPANSFNANGAVTVFTTPNSAIRYFAFSTGGVSANHYHAVDIAQFNSGNTGGDGAHNNLQPYLTVNYIIKI